LTGAGRQFLRFGKFNAVGLLGAGLQVLLLYLLIERCNLAKVAATPITVEIAVIHNFLWHERFTWRDRECAGVRATITRFWRFHAGNGLVSLVGNTAVISALGECCHIPALPAAAAAIALCAPVNFWLADRWVYAAPTPLRCQNISFRPN